MLVRSRSAAGRRRQAGSTFRNVNLTKLRWAMARPSNIRSGSYQRRSGARVAACLVRSRSAPGRRDAGPRAAIVFWPGPAAEGQAAGDRAPGGARRAAFGFMSSIQGSYTPEQALLDISAGSRTWTSLYDGEVPSRSAAGRGDGRICGVGRDRRARARRAPADIVPGLLGADGARRGRARRLRRAARGRNREAIVAADRSAGAASLARLARRGRRGRAPQWRRDRPARREAARRARRVGRSPSSRGTPRRRTSCSWSRTRPASPPAAGDRRRRARGTARTCARTRPARMASCSDRHRADRARSGSASSPRRHLGRADRGPRRPQPGRAHRAARPPRRGRAAALGGGAGGPARRGRWSRGLGAARGGDARLAAARAAAGGAVAAVRAAR